MEQLYVQLVTRLGWYALVNGNLSFGASIDRWISAKSWNGGVARGVRISYVCMHGIRSKRLVGRFRSRRKRRRRRRRKRGIKVRAVVFIANQTSTGVWYATRIRNWPELIGVLILPGRKCCINPLGRSVKPIVFVFFDSGTMGGWLGGKLAYGGRTFISENTNVEYRWAEKEGRGTLEFYRASEERECLGGGGVEARMMNIWFESGRKWERKGSLAEIIVLLSRYLDARVSLGNTTFIRQGWHNRGEGREFRFELTEFHRLLFAFCLVRSFVLFWNLISLKIGILLFENYEVFRNDAKISLPFRYNPTNLSGSYLRWEILSNVNVYIRYTCDNSNKGCRNIERFF